MKEILKNDINKENLEEQCYLDKLSSREQTYIQQNNLPIRMKSSPRNSNKLFQTYDNVFHTDSLTTKPSNLNFERLYSNQLLFHTHYPIVSKQNEVQEEINGLLKTGIRGNIH